MLSPALTADLETDVPNLLRCNAFVPGRLTGIWIALTQIAHTRKTDNELVHMIVRAQRYIRGRGEGKERRVSNDDNDDDEEEVGQERPFSLALKQPKESS